MYICNGIVALLVVWPGPSDCSGMAQGTVCMIAGYFPRLSFDYDTQYTGNLCAGYKRALNDFKIVFEEFVTTPTGAGDLTTSP